MVLIRFSVLLAHFFSQCRRFFFCWAKNTQKLYHSFHVYSAPFVFSRAHPDAFRFVLVLYIPENSWNCSAMEIASFISFLSFIVRVVSSANLFFVVLACKFLFLFSSIQSLMSGLFLIFIASISTAIINRSGINGNLCRISLSVGNQLDS